MKSKETELLYIYLCIDLFLLNVALIFVGWVNLQISVRDYQLISSYLLHGNMAWIITYLALTKKNLFLHDKFRNRAWRITRRHIVFLVTAAALALVFVPHNFSRRFFMQYSILFYFEKLIFYWLFYKYLRFKRGNQINTVQTAVIGCGKTGSLIRQIIDSNPNMGYVFSGFICDNMCPTGQYLGSPENLEALIDEHKIQMIFYSISMFNGDNSEDQAKEVLKICNRKGVRLRFIPINQRWFRNRMRMEVMGDLLVINPQEIPLDHAGYRVQKRLFDILFSIFVIVFIFSWLFPIIALLIKLESRGPVFFIQERTGINNKTFRCLKFRSMRQNSQANEKQATADDNRITKLGRFMRKTNIDELPQFINVLRGNMSVVGPRPHMLKHTDDYSALIDYYLIRHYVKPGITGWAQVKGYRGETQQVNAMERRVSADMKYIENWTFLWDLKIIWLTIFGKSSYHNAV
ncbi:MAG TPA: exopolysaccharide biosynthesis polyprenyl glycosylphosphotransferase [Draconibacterium sp.]|nr:exopolysaccharide biosynthesis polyprenyl glycosylphosphotransferase [Draconibacterium sp.]